MPWFLPFFGDDTTIAHHHASATAASSSFADISLHRDVFSPNVGADFASGVHHHQHAGATSFMMVPTIREYIVKFGVAGMDNAEVIYPVSMKYAFLFHDVKIII